MFTHSVVNLAGRSQIQIAADDRSEMLESGVYDVWTSEETGAYISVITDSEQSNATSGTGYFVPPSSVISVRICANHHRISASAAIVIHKVD